MNCIKLNCYYCKHQIEEKDEWVFYNFHILHKECKLKYKYK